MFKKGFTLAEVLITLAIIGVIATMTLPTLNYNIKTQTLEKQTLKFYNQLQSAVGIALAQNPMGVELNDTFIRKNFNVLNICDNNNRASCLGTELSANSANYNTLSTENPTIKALNLFPPSLPIYMLADGTIFNVFQSGTTYIVTFDVNGQAEPNTYGRDVWKVSVFSDGSIDDSNMTPQVRQTAAPANISTLLQTSFNNCRNGIVDGSAVYDSESKIVGHNVSSCFGHFIRNNFKFDY